MRNLVPIRGNFSHFLNIVSKRHIATRTSIKLIENSVHGRYKKFVSRARQNDLVLFDVSYFSGANSALLASCYGKTEGVKKLKEEIYANQTPNLRYSCQYCMIGQSDDGFDHYLPKESFCEFAVLSNNLIPCCSHCNTLKGEEWKDIGIGRNIINLYYDQIPNIQFLFCNVNIISGTPNISFSINNPGGIPAPDFRIIDRHFNRLNLLDRFGKHSNTVVTDIVDSLSPSIHILSLAEASQHLIDEANASKVSFGNNYWKAILKETLASNVQFLSNIGFV